jgi:hypothetical protein
MNNDAIKTLEEIRIAQAIIEEQRADPELNPQEKKQLEKLCVVFTDLENALIHAKQDELVAKLTDDTRKLLLLSKEMDKSAAKLSGIAHKVEMAAKAVEGFIKVLGTAGSAGIMG